VCKEDAYGSVSTASTYGMVTLGNCSEP